MKSSSDTAATNFRTVLRSASILSIGMRAYFIGMSFLLTVILANVLGPESFGQYSFLMSIALLASGLAQAGAVPLLVRETAKSKSYYKVWQSVRFTLLLVISALVGGLGLLVLIFSWPGAGSSQLTIAVLLAILLGATAVTAAAVRGLGHTLLGQLADFILRPTLFVLAIVATILLSSLTSAVQTLMLHAVAAFAGLLFTVAILARKLARLDRQRDARFDRMAWLRSLGTIASVAWFGVASAQLIVIMTGILADPVTVAGFRVAVQFAALMAIGLSAVEAVQAPRFTTAWMQEDRQRMQRLILTSSRLSLAVALPVGSLLAIIPDTLLAAFFSPDYATAANAIRILALGQLVNAFVGSAGTMLIACGFEKHVVRVNAAVLLTVVGGGWALIPVAGLNGAAATVVLSLLVRNTLCALLAYRKLGIYCSPIVNLATRSAS